MSRLETMQVSRVETLYRTLNTGSYDGVLAAPEGEDGTAGSAASGGKSGAGGGGAAGGGRGKGTGKGKGGKVGRAGYKKQNHSSIRVRAVGTKDPLMTLAQAQVVGRHRALGDAIDTYFGYNEDEEKADGGTDGMGPSELRTVGEELHAALGRNTERQALNGVPCLICRDKRAEFGFLHVGRPELGVHHGACEDCATQLQQTADKGKHPPCPICRNACTPIKVHCSM